MKLTIDIENWQNFLHNEITLDNFNPLIKTHSWPVVRIFYNSSTRLVVQVSKTQFIMISI